MTVKEIELSPKQCEFINNATHRYNGKIGATQCGKTFVDVAYTIPSRIFERRGKPGLYLMLGVTKETIERNVLEPMRDFWGSKVIGEINSRNIARLFGEKVYCLGAEKITQVTKLRGAKIKYAYCDELVDLNQEVFELLRSRLSLGYSVCDFTGNPSYPDHYVKKFIDSDADVYCQKWTIDDNPFLDPVRAAELKREYAGTVYYARYINGDWQLAEGLIYPDYQAAIVPTISRVYTEYQISVDYGIQNPFAMGLYGLCEGVWYKVKEYHHSGRETQHQKTDGEYYNDLVSFAENLKIRRLIIDPSATSFITLVRRNSKFTVYHADNAVLDGIRNTASAMKKGIFKINDCCVETIKEFQVYSWDDKGQDEPLKVSDHHMDANRYFVHTNNIAFPVRRYL